MRFLDELDLIFHNLPWRYLVTSSIIWYPKREKKEIIS